MLGGIKNFFTGLGRFLPKSGSLSKAADDGIKKIGDDVDEVLPKYNSYAGFSAVSEESGEVVAKSSKTLQKVVGGVVGGTALAGTSVTLGIIYRKEIETFFKDLFNQNDAVQEIEGAQLTAVDDHSNAGSSVSAQLAEDGGTIGVLGSAHADQVRGNSGSNYLAGQGGSDTLAGGAGNDVLDGGTGADVIEGGEGEDGVDYSGSDAGVWVDLASGESHGGHAEGDQLSGIEHLVGSGNHTNTLKGTDGTNMLTGGSGDDVLEGRGGDDVLIGGAGADVLDGGEGLDVAEYSASDAGVVVDLTTGEGSQGHAEGDRLLGIDHVTGSEFDDRLMGTDGSNVLSGEAGSDLVEGGGGDDVLLGGTGADTLNGGEGIDTVFYNASESGVVIDLAAGTGSGGDAEGDQLSGIESVIGSGHADRLSGNEDGNLLSGGQSDDVLEGRGGDDYLIGGAGADVLNGAGGEDLADYTASDAGVTVDLAIGGGSGGDAEGDQLAGVDHLLGSRFNDVLRGQDGWNNVLGGGDGQDVLDGRSGDDTLIGDAGDDVLTGGEGNDTFVLKGAIGHDVITDFGSGDVIELSAADEDFLDGYSVMQAAEQAGNDVVIRLDAERSITLANTQLDSLGHEDFLVAA